MSGASAVVANPYILAVPVGGNRLPPSMTLRFPQKDPADELPIGLDWSDWCGAVGDTVASFTYAIAPAGTDSGLVAWADAIDGGQTLIWVKGGAPGQDYAITFQMVTAAGRSVTRTAYMLAAPVSATTLTGTAVLMVPGAKGLTGRGVKPGGLSLDMAAQRIAFLMTDGTTEYLDIAPLLGAIVDRANAGSGAVLDPVSGAPIRDPVTGEPIRIPPSPSAPHTEAIRDPLGGLAILDPVAGQEIRPAPSAPPQGVSVLDPYTGLPVRDPQSGQAIGPAAAPNGPDPVRDPLTGAPIADPRTGQTVRDPSAAGAPVATVDTHSTVQDPITHDPVTDPVTGLPVKDPL